MLILNHTYTSSINPLSLRDALPIWNVANSADEFECRLVAVDAAKVRGRANGSANVAAEREVSESGSERGCSATGGTAGRARKIPRVVGGAVDGVVALQIGEGDGNVRFSDDDGAGAENAIDGDGVVLGSKIFGLDDAGGGGHAFHAVAFLDGDWHAV